MDIQKRPLYNSLRMNWLIDPTLEVEAWQVENYREMSLPLLFSRLKQYGLEFDKESFCLLADEYETPEDLTDELLGNQVLEVEDEDRIYLLLFELWRRLETDKPCLSVFCDELDHQIFLYDQGKTDNVEGLQDALSNLQVILDESCDEGGDPLEVMESVNTGCANDIETFLYDFISEQIDNGNYSYAIELIDGFINYIEDDKWYEFLRVRILGHTDPEGASILIQQLAEEACNDDDLSFNLEVLSEMVQEGDEESFVSLVKRSMPLIENEDDFQDLLNICTNYYCCQDLEEKEKALHQLLENRAQKAPTEKFFQDDPDLKRLFDIIS